MAQADTKFSAGARLERKAFREYLRRLIHKSYVGLDEYQKVLTWVTQRQARYDKKKGGLGK